MHNEISNHNFHRTNQQNELHQQFNLPQKIIFSKTDGWTKTSQIKNSPSATFGRSGRNSNDKKNSPGPGQYQLAKQSLEKKGITLKGTKLFKLKTDGPGPCAYNPKVEFSSKKYSICKSQSKEKQVICPSPVSYNITDSRSFKGITFGKQAKIQQKSGETPGPGQYLTEKSTFQLNKYSFPKQKKFFQQSIREQIKSSIPGPNAYDIAKIRSNSKSYKFSKALKSCVDETQTPGPAQYKCDTSTYTREGVAFFKEKRDFNYENHIPGPGTYKQVDINAIKKREPKVAIPKSEKSFTASTNNIGPGAYMKQNPDQKIKGGVIGRSQRSLDKQQKMPDPLSYNPNFNQIFTKTGSVKIGNQRRLSYSNFHTPGPGAYQSDKRLNIASRVKCQSEFKRMNSTTLAKSKKQQKDRSMNLTSMSHQ